MKSVLPAFSSLQTLKVLETKYLRRSTYKEERLALAHNSVDFNPWSVAFGGNNGQ
jgi:hypothetical protein